MPPETLSADAWELLWRIVPCLVLGAVAVYLLAPRPQPLPAWWGATAGLLAIVLAGAFLIRTGATVEGVLFYLFAGIAVLGGALLITQTNPARAALAFALVILATCGLFLLQAAPFLMAATIIIYAGAIIVTFLFVLMLSQQEGKSDADWRAREPLLACLAGFILLGALLYVLLQTYRNPRTTELLAPVAMGDERPEDKRLNALLNRVEQLPPTATADELTQAGDQLVDKMLKALATVPHEPSLARLDRAVKSHDDRWFDVKVQKNPERSRQFLKSAVADLRKEVEQARLTVGDLRPDGTQPLSSFSGPPPSELVPHDAFGNAPLPAENTAQLGKSLFTDYLLAVELGGTLLLVATVGAIAIASRRGARGGDRS